MGEASFGEFDEFIDAALSFQFGLEDMGEVDCFDFVELLVYVLDECFCEELLFSGLKDKELYDDEFFEEEMEGDLLM